MENEARIPSFAVFCRYAEDFRGYFLPGVFGDCYRKEDAYKACVAVHPQFVALSAELQEMENSTSLAYRTKLYEAYKLMRPYAKREQDILVRVLIRSQYLNGGRNEKSKKI